jgi:hypothetical protein
MSRAKQLAVLILLGSAAIALAIVVWVLNQTTSNDLLAVIGLLGGIAIIVNSLPLGNGHKNGNGV